jgi:hypothetical protein
MWAMVRNPRRSALPMPLVQAERLALSLHTLEDGAGGRERLAAGDSRSHDHEPLIEVGILGPES